MFDYQHCRICGEPVLPALEAMYQRRIENAHCGSVACIRKEMIQQHGCCELAEPIACVCAYAFRCPTHGDRHIGTHD